MYTTAWCGYCRAAKRLLEREELAYEEVSVDDDPHFRQRMYELSGRTTVPQIIIDGESIGGYQELARLLALGAIDTGLEAGAEA